MNVSEQLQKVARLVRSRTTTVHQIKEMDDTDANRAIKRLREIAAIGSNVNKAKKRWIDEVSSGMDSSRIVYTSTYYKDVAALDISSGFLANRQNFLPVKIQTIQKRLMRFSVLDYYIKSTRAEDEIKKITKLAEVLMKALIKFKKFKDKHGEIPKTVDYGTYTIINRAGITQDKIDEIKETLDYVDRYVKGQYCYGDVYLATNKELGRGGNNLASYSESNDSFTLALDVNSKNRGDDMIHEIGHRILHKHMDSETKRKIFDIYKKALSEDSGVSYNNIQSFLMKGATRTRKLSRDDMEAKFAIESNPEALRLYNEYLQSVERQYQVGVKMLEDFVQKWDIRLKVDFAGYLAAVTQGIANKLFRPFVVEVSNTSGDAVDDLNNILKIWVRGLNEVGHKVYTKTILKQFEVEGGYFPSPYSKVDLDEFFCENFRVYCTKEKRIHPEMVEVMKKYA